MYSPPLSTAIMTMRSRISSGYYQEDYKLPNQAQLSVELGLPIQHVRHVLYELEKDGLIVIVPRKGSFIPNGHVSLPIKIAEYIIRERVHSGTYEFRLPSRYTLERDFGLSSNELNLVLGNFENEGLIHREKGSTIFYIGAYGKERYLTAKFHREFPNGIKRGKLSKHHNAFYRHLLRSGMLENLVPADPVAVERGREWGRRNRKN